MRIRFLIALIGLLPCAGLTHTSETIQNLALVDYTGWLIDSDANNGSPGYERNVIKVTSTINFTTVENSPSTYDYQMSFRLLNSQGDPVPLIVGLGQTSTVHIVTDSVTLPFFISQFIVKSTTRVYTPSLNPAVRLDPYDSYRVELSLYERPDGNGRYAATGDSAVTALHTFYHFTNLVSGDSGFNVIAKLTGAGFNRSYAVETIPGKDTFEVSVGCTLRRWDNFNLPPANHNISVRFDYELIDGVSGNPVPLVTDNITVVKSMASYVNGAPDAPAILNFGQLIEIEPVSQIQSADHVYYARITVSHVELLNQPLVEGNDMITPTVRLLHFNGHLFFGAIETIFTSIDNIPAAGLVVPGSHVITALGVDNNSGYILTHASHTYGNGANLDVRLLNNGNAVLNSGSVQVNEPVPDKDEIANVRIERQNIVLDVNGAHGTVIATLPTGFGYRANITGRLLSSKIAWPGVALNQDLTPINDLTYGAPFFGCEESKPFWVGANAMTWQVNVGRFVIVPSGALHYVRAKELNELEAETNLKEADMKLKRSNEQYFRWLQGVTGGSQVLVLADSAGNARMSLEAEFVAGQFTTHFPYDSFVRWTGNGHMKVTADQVISSDSFLTSALTIVNRYDRDCPGCGPGVGRAPVTVVPENAELRFTVDGGISAAGAMASPRPLTWGWIAEPSIQKYAQRTTDFSESSFLMAGCFLRGDQTSLQAEHRPGVIMLTGVLPTDLTYLERPGQPAYLDGFADYAGMNFRVMNNGAKQGESVLAGVASGLYDLTGRSKYYTRWSGVSGIHEAVQGTFKEELTLYGYQFTFSNYGLSYLSSQNHESRTEGHVHVVAPSNFDQNFKELMFSCVGALEDAKVPADEVGMYKLLEYWNADFVTMAVGFDREDGADCNPGVGYLVLGVKAHATYVEEPLFGNLGFKNNGNLISAADVASNEILLDDGFNSRLKVPNNFKLAGQTNEIYSLNPVIDAYFNDWEKRDQSVPQGHLNLAAELDVPFFENLKVHIHTVAKTNLPYAPIYLMGGWPDHGFGTANDNFFTDADFDADNVGRPSGVGVTNYHHYHTEDYHPRAQVSWLGVIDFDYPLSWSPSLRAFKSFEPESTDILILKAEHQVKHLSAKNAELTFGAEYESLPGMNIATIAFNAIDENVGVLQAFMDAGLEPVRFKMERGFGALNKMLNANPHDLFENPMLHIQDSVYAFYTELEYYWETTQQFPMNFVVNDYFDPLTGNFIERFRDLATAQIGLINQLDLELTYAIEAVEAVQSLLAEDGGSRTVASQLMMEVLRNLDPELASTITDLAGGAIDGKFNDYLKKYDGALDQTGVALNALSNTLATLKGKLAANQDFAKELEEILSAHDGQLQQMVTQVKQQVLDYFNSFNPADDPIEDIGYGEIGGFIMQKFKDKFFALPVAPAMQVAIKQRLYDTDAAIREATDSGMGLVNTSLREMVNEVLSMLDNAFKSLLGKVGLTMSSAALKGYAHINGDSLKLLRLDLKVRMQTPDVVEFSGYFQIKELDSENTPTECLPASGKATEVTCGAAGIPIKLGNSDVKLSVNTKFTFDSGGPVPFLIGMGGNVILDGSINFQTLEVTYINAGAAFGEFENYISCAARVKIKGYEGAGGIFMGKACSVGFLSWDPQVEELLGQGSFTGFYFYGEVWIPISEAWFGIPASCFFQVSAGVGAGFGAFFEGPTFVGRMLMGVSGDVLCIVSIKCTMSLAGKANPDGLSLSGVGRLEGEIGPCPVCIDFSKELKLKYQNEEWDVDF